jgi:hypothetical protein
MGTEVADRGCAELTSNRAMLMEGSVVFFSAAVAAVAAAGSEAEVPEAGAEAQAASINGAHTASTQMGTRMSARW